MKKYKVLVTTPSFCKFSDAPWKLLEEAGIQVDFVPGASHNQIMEKIEDCDAVITGVERFDRSAIEKAKKLKAITIHGVGTDAVDSDALKEKGLTCRNVRNANTEAVADLTFGHILAAARGFTDAARRMEAGDFSRVYGVPVYGRTLGILGLGAIGKAVARRAKGFDMKILAWDIYWDEVFAKKYDIQYAELDEILATCDIVTLHLPLTSETENLIDMSKLKTMKKEAVIVNCARGGIINEKDLYTALKEKVIFACGLDAFAEEPPGKNPLFELPNVTKTPHIGGYTEESLNALSMGAAKNIIEEIQKYEEAIH